MQVPAPVVEYVPLGQLEHEAAAAPEKVLVEQAEQEAAVQPAAYVPAPHAVHAPLTSLYPGRQVAALQEPLAEVMVAAPVVKEQVRQVLAPAAE